MELNTEKYLQDLSGSWYRNKISPIHKLSDRGVEEMKKKTVPGLWVLVDHDLETDSFCVEWKEVEDVRIPTGRKGAKWLRDSFKRKGIKIHIAYSPINEHKPKQK